MKAVNPKDIQGAKKPPLNLIPPVALVHEARAMQNGADKYGPFNWREKRVLASVYIGAMMRHLAAYADGEDDAADSEIPHLAHIRACAAILLDAAECGQLGDDRPTKGTAGALIEALVLRDGPLEVDEITKPTRIMDIPAEILTETTTCLGCLGYKDVHIYDLTCLEELKG